MRVGGGKEKKREREEGRMRKEGNRQTEKVSLCNPDWQGTHYVY